MASRTLVAGPPFVTDDPGTPGRGAWEVNVSHNILRTKHALLMSAPFIDVNYGLLANDEWNIALPVLFADSDRGESHWGVGDLQMHWKYRFAEEDALGLSAAITPLVFMPTGNEELGLGTGDTTLLIPVEVGKHFCDQKLFVYGELGYRTMFGESEDNHWIYGLVAEWQASEKTALMLEVGGVAFARDGAPDDTFFNLGLKQELNENVAFLASVGRSFHDRDRGTPDLLSFVGLQFKWGGREPASDFVPAK